MTTTVSLAAWLLLLPTTATAFTLPSGTRPCYTNSVVRRTRMQPDGFDDWMQPTGEDFDTHPHARNVRNLKQSNNEPTPYEMRRAYYQEAPPAPTQTDLEVEAQVETQVEAQAATTAKEESRPAAESQMARDQDPQTNDKSGPADAVSAPLPGPIASVPPSRDQQLIDQMERAQDQYERFVSDPYGSSGHARYGHGIAQPPQVPEQMIQRQQEQGEADPSIPSSHEEFIQNPYGSSGPDRYGHGIQQPPQAQVPEEQSIQGRASLERRPARTTQSTRDQFIENPYGSSGPDRYGHGIQQPPQAPPLQQEASAASSLEEEPPEHQVPKQIRQGLPKTQKKPPSSSSPMEQFIENPYGNKGPERYGHGIAQPPPAPQVPERTIQRGQMEEDPARSPPPPQQQQRPSHIQQMQQSQSQSPMDEFIENPYGNKAAPDGYVDGQGDIMASSASGEPQPQLQQTQEDIDRQQLPPPQKSFQEEFIENPYGNKAAPDGYHDTGVSSSMRQFQQQRKRQRQLQDAEDHDEFIDNHSGTNRMEYGYGANQPPRTPKKVLVRHRRNRNKNRKPLSRMDDFINNPKGSTYTAGQYGYGNDGDEESSGYYDYGDNDYGIEGRRE